MGKAVGSTEEGILETFAVSTTKGCIGNIERMEGATDTTAIVCEGTTVDKKDGSIKAFSGITVGMGGFDEDDSDGTTEVIVIISMGGVHCNGTGLGGCPAVGISVFLDF